jgi:hypothetical protein
MSYIEEKVTVYAPVKVIWKIWANKYLQNGLEIGKKNFVVTEKKKGIKFEIQDYKENESLTVVWYSSLIKLIFYHKVEPKDIGSLVTCRVKLKGFFSFLIKPLIAGKIRKDLQISLKQFSRDLNKI